MRETNTGIADLIGNRFVIRSSATNWSCELERDGSGGRRDCARCRHLFANATGGGHPRVSRWVLSCLLENYTGRSKHLSVIVPKLRHSSHPEMRKRGDFPLGPLRIVPRSRRQCLVAPGNQGADSRETGSYGIGWCHKEPLGPSVLVSRERPELSRLKLQKPG